MAAGNPKKKLQAELTCCLCLDFFTDPVLMECGHNFCKACILKCWKKPTMPTASCPQCRKPIKNKSWMPNRQLANVVDIVKQLKDQEAVAGEVCESHQEPLKFFCQDDEAPICVVCERSKGHREHHVIPVEEAAEEYKNKILTSLEKKKEELLACKEKTEQQSQELLNKVEKERERTVAAFRDLQQFLAEKENHLLAQMKEVDQEIAKKRDEEIARLLEELSSLENTIQELEDKCEQSPHELLKDITSMVQRCEQEEKFENPVAFPPALKWRIWNFWAFSPILENMTKKFKDTLKTEYQQHKETVILNPQTAHPQLLISEDGKCLTLGDEWQSLPESDERFVHHQCVLGSDWFQSGIHYWEVDVVKEGWAIGIYTGCFYDEIKALHPKTGILAIGKWDGQYRVVVSPVNPPLHLNEEPEKIRVSVNCMGNQVAFFDAETAAMLYTFSTDLNVLCRPFFWLYKKSCLRISK